MRVGDVMRTRGGCYAYACRVGDVMRLRGVCADPRALLSRPVASSPRLALVSVNQWYEKLGTPCPIRVDIRVNIRVTGPVVSMSSVGAGCRMPRECHDEWGCNAV